MKTKYLISFFILLMLSGVVTVILFGVQPRAVPKIKMSVFANNDVIINSLYIALAGDLIDAKVFFFGVDPNNAQTAELVNKFIIKSNTFPNKYDVVLLDESIADIAAAQSAEKFSIKNNFERLATGLQEVIKQKKRLLVVLPHVEASAKLEGSIVDKLKKYFANTPGLISSLILTNFSRSHEDEKNLSIACNTGAEDLAGVANLGCYILQKSRAYYRKHYPVGSNVGFLEQIGTGEFLFLITKEPQTSAL